MTFRAQVEVGLGADPQAGPGAVAWTDATRWCRAAPLAISRGKADEFSSPPPSKLTCRVDNRGGRWVARNALGPWYGLIRRNIPIRVLADADNWPTPISDTFGRTVAAGSWGVTDTMQAWALDLAGGSGSLTDFSVSSGAGRATLTGAVQARRALIDSLYLTDADLTWSTTLPMPVGGNLEVLGYLRWRSNAQSYQFKLVIAPGGAVQYTIISNGVALQALTTISGLTHAAATPLRVRAQAYGTTVRMRVWQGAEPSTWLYSGVDPSPAGQAGQVGVRMNTAAGVSITPTFTIDDFTVTVPPIRFAGYIDELPVRWDPSGNDSTVDISASGVFRRLSQNSAPLRSALYRARTSASYVQPSEFWPMEDASGSTSYVNVAPGGAAMAVSDQSPGSSGVFEGSQSLPTWGSIRTQAPVRPNSTATSYAWRFGMYTLSQPPVNTAFVMWRTANWLWQVANAGSVLVLQAFDNTGVERLSAPTTIGFVSFQGRPCQYEVNITQNGANIDWLMRITYFDISGGATQNISGTLASTGFEWPYTVTPLGAGGPMTGWTLGHLALYTDTSASPASLAGRGWPGNTAAQRIAGILNDARIPHSVPNDPSGVSTTLLGPQTLTSIPGQLQIAATSDGGQLFEDGLTVSYRSRWSLYSQPVSLALDVTTGKQLRDHTATDDDQGVINDITVSRLGGSSAQATNAAHILLYGRSEGTASVSVYDDGYLPNQAAWRVAAGTVDDMRHPTVAINLTRNPALRNAWVQMQPGDRVQIANPLPELGSNVIDLMLQGWSETIDPGANLWTASLNCTSYKQWVAWVVEANSGDIGKPRSGAAFINTAFNSSATSISVKTTTGYPVWLTGAQSTLLWCGGEVMRVTNVTGSSSPQTFTVVRGINGVAKAHVIDEQIDVYQPGVVVL